MTKNMLRRNSEPGEIQKTRAGTDQKRTANNETNNGSKKELTQLQKQPRAISVFSH